MRPHDACRRCSSSMFLLGVENLFMVHADIGDCFSIVVFHLASGSTIFWGSLSSPETEKHPFAHLHRLLKGFHVVAPSLSEALRRE